MPRTAFLLAMTLLLAHMPCSAEPGSGSPDAPSGTVATAGYKASNPVLDARIANTNYSVEERANIETAMQFLSAKRPIRAEDRARYFAKDYMATRHGMDSLTRISGFAPRSEGSYTESSMTDREDELIDVIAKRDRVWLFFKMNGHHTGTWFGQPATGKPISIHELGILQFADGKIVEAYFMAEELELAEQLGIGIGPFREPKP